MKKFIVVLLFGLAIALPGTNLYAMSDADADGVADAGDRCQATGAGVPVNDEGCPADSDGDGVMDAHDRCPGTYGSIEMDSYGCPVDPTAADRDGDADGVADINDRCIATGSGVPVNKQGCPADQDGDGVIDAHDRCPDSGTAEMFNSYGCVIVVDADGDGVTDAMDTCANTPQDQPVNDFGCRLELDADGDGVTIDADLCPATGSGVPVDELGCAEDGDFDLVIDAHDRCPNSARTDAVDSYGCKMSAMGGAMAHHGKAAAEKAVVKKAKKMRKPDRRGYVRVFTVRVGSYRNNRDAQKTMAAWKAKGESTYLHRARDKRRRLWYMVSVGDYDTRAEAEAALKQVRKTVRDAHVSRIRIKP